MFNNVSRRLPLLNQIRRECQDTKPQHLICFKNWTSEMVMNLLNSAINLKSVVGNTHNKRMDVLADSKVMVLQEVNQPVLNMAVSKAATMLGAYDVTIIDHVVWERDYNGRIFSMMSDAIFVSTSTFKCVQRFAKQSTVPVICMMSRAHATLQALSTVMTILKSPVSPLLFKASKDMTQKTSTVVQACKTKEEVLFGSSVVIAGPTPKKKKKVKIFAMDIQDILRATQSKWIFIHTCPRGKEVDDYLFYHKNSRTFRVFENMLFIAGALMAKSIKGFKF